FHSGASSGCWCAWRANAGFDRREGDWTSTLSSVRRGARSSSGRRHGARSTPQHVSAAASMGGTDPALPESLRGRELQAHVLHEALEVLEVRELEGDLALALAHVDAHGRLEAVRQPARQVHDVRIVGAAANGAG